jgi:lipopolysaccharide transport system ATP-binding protein
MSSEAEPVPVADAPAIEARGLGKAYLIYATPGDRLRQAVEPRLRRALRPLARAALGRELPEREYFSRYWALRGVHFHVGQGETVGIIGRNGSGKSTLLQMVCGTLNPTEGEVVTRGRVAALLELGSGFNPEYTGRENVFLNASVLGLTHVEAQARLDDILAFADIGDFVDQPVKTYSSGMGMRLAFSVIAHVDADILVIDEALAVGDAYFQQKCMRWLRRFRERGTVLFCGHDTGAVMSLCQRAIWLDRGVVRMMGPAKDVSEAYSAFIFAQTMGLPEELVRIAQPRVSEAPPAADSRRDDDGPASLAPVTAPADALRLPPPPEAGPAIFDTQAVSSRFGSGQAEILGARMMAASGAELTWIEGDEEVAITARIRAHAEIESPIVGFIVKDRLGQPLLGDNTFRLFRNGSPPVLLAGEEWTARFAFRLPRIASGRYAVTVAVASGTLENHVQHHWLHDAFMFDVHSPYQNGTMIAVPMLEMTLTVAEAATAPGS